MSRNYAHHQHHVINSKPPVVVNDNDVLSGRGVNIAHHAGNERFRTLVTTRADQSYCATYSASEKRAVAEEVIAHIQSLDPPGRFLKRDGRGQVSRGLNGPWEELTEREAIKKTCQALRDCNRTDRAGYAIGVVPPEDVIKSAESRASSGMSGKQYAAAAAAAQAAAASAAASATLKRTRDQLNTGVYPLQSHSYGLDMPQANGGPQSPNETDWSKKQRHDEEAFLQGQCLDPNNALGVGADGLLSAPPLTSSAEHHISYSDASMDNAAAVAAAWVHQSVSSAPAPGYLDDLAHDHGGLGSDDHSGFIGKDDDVGSFNMTMLERPTMFYTGQTQNLNSSSPGR